MKIIFHWFTFAFAIVISVIGIAGNAETTAYQQLEIVQRSRVASQEKTLTAQRQPRVALVIGNAAYQEDALTNPVNDAADIAKALRELGFEVTLLQNKDLKAMDEAIENFSRQLRQGGVGVFYYAGHGVQVEGENYLIPLSARLNRQQDVRYEAVPLGKVLNAMEAAETQVNIVIIDACRDNPFYRRWRSGRRGSGSIRGLTKVELPPQGTVIAFATAPGDFAEDGKGRNSPFTSHLLRHIMTPNQDVVLMFRQVRAEVLRDTNNEQEPWYQESLVGSFSFNTTSETTPPIATNSHSPSPLHDLLLAKLKKLEELLNAKKWEQADDLSYQIMLEIAGPNSKKEGRFITGEWEVFPGSELEKIDEMWSKASNGQFGFRAQREVFESVNQHDMIYYEEIKWKKADTNLWLVEWRYQKGQVVYIKKPDFNKPLSELPKGYLPSKLEWETRADHRFDMIAACWGGRGWTIEKPGAGVMRGIVKPNL